MQTLGEAVRLEFHLFYQRLLFHYVNTSKHFSKPNLNWNTIFSQLLVDNVVFTVFLSVDNDGQNILKLFQKLPLCPDFNVGMASRLIQGQTRTLDNNASCEMLFLWGIIYVRCHFCELVFLIRRVPFFVTFHLCQWVPYTKVDLVILTKHLC